MGRGGGGGAMNGADRIESGLRARSRGEHRARGRGDPEILNGLRSTFEAIVNRLDSGGWRYDGLGVGARATISGEPITSL